MWSTRYGIGLSSSKLGQSFVLLLLVLRIEGFVLGADRPDEVEQLAGGGAARHFRRLAGVAQAPVEGLDRRVVLGRAEGRHVQGGAQPPIAAAPDRGSATEAAPRLA